MKRTAIHLAILGLFVLSFAQVALPQQAVTVAGKWEATARLPEGMVTEQWTIQQDGHTVTATIKGPRGEMKVTGEVVNDVTFRVDFTVGTTPHKVMATIDKDAMDGSLMIGTKQYIWQAKRSTS